jgi:hypothetical protein
VQSDQFEAFSEAFIQTYADQEKSGDHPLMQSFNGLGYVVFKRTYARQKPNGETEEWHETVKRVIEGAQAIGAGYTQAEAVRLYDLIWNLKAIPGGRMLWQLGTENNARLGGDSLVNCWYTDIKSADDFRFLFNQLMLGGGVGFNVTPEGVNRLPVVEAGFAYLTTGFDVDYIVPDNREGWGELLRRVIESHFLGEDFTYSVDAVRPEGAPIKTFGGVASGPGILVEGIDSIQGILVEARGRKLSTVEVLDICNIIGSIVVSGNVRRSAQIALGSAMDDDYLGAKNWGSGEVPFYRAMSNNTVMVERIADLPEHFWDGYDGSGEPYGLFNLSAARAFGRMGEQHLDPSISGVNPCGEIPLAHRESCNLAELVLPRLDSLGEAIEAARLLYKMQKAVAALPFLDWQTNKVAHRNMRLGLGVTGIAQSGGKVNWLKYVYENLREFDAEWSAERGLPTSIRLTTVKPSGTLSLLAGVTPGAHPGYSMYHVRRVRMSATDGLVNWCRERGYHVEFASQLDGSIDPRTVVVEFPAMFPVDTWTADNASALSQLQTLSYLQENWADNAVSITVTYLPQELSAIKDYLAANWPRMKSVSFLPYTDHGFVQAPLEPLTRDEYLDRVKVIEETNEFYRGLSEIGDDECATGACPVR